MRHRLDRQESFRHLVRDRGDPHCGGHWLDLIEIFAKFERSLFVCGVLPFAESLCCSAVILKDDF